MFNFCLPLFRKLPLFLQRKPSVLVWSLTATTWYEKQIGSENKRTSEHLTYRLDSKLKSPTEKAQTSVNPHATESTPYRHIPPSWARFSLPWYNTACVHRVYSISMELCASPLPKGRLKSKETRRQSWTLERDTKRLWNDLSLVPFTHWALQCFLRELLYFLHRSNSLV